MKEDSGGEMTTREENNAQLVAEGKARQTITIKRTEFDRLLEGLRNIEIDAQGGITYGGMEEILIRIKEKSTQLRTELIKTYGE